jgi:2-polyprenyl-6-methoxyphenol hydroxylase-like FAD-dependent oxidoreductase
MERRMRMLVAGGSLGGLFAANLLLRAGHDVHVYERVADELEGRGAGIVTHAELLVSLCHAGVTIDETLGVSVQQRITLDPGGARVASRDLPQMFTAWSRLYLALRSAFPGERYHNGKQLASFAQDARGVEVRFSDGSGVQGDLLVAADGFRSSVRQVLAPDRSPRYAGYVAWRGLVDEARLSERARRDIFPYFAFGLPPGEQMVAYPVAGAGHVTTPGHRRYNFVWYRPASEETLQDMVTDGSGKSWPDGIPPPLIRPELLARTRQAARDVLAPQFAEVVEKTDGLFFQPIFDLECERLAFGRIALLGDAAFVARPHCGMGVTKAAGDAEALVAALHAQPDVVAALREYESTRLRYGSFIVDHARHLGAYMQAQLATPTEVAMAERYRTPEAVMRDTAVVPAHAV